MIKIKSQIGISIVTYNSPNIFLTLDNLIEEVFPNFSCKVYLYDNNSTSEFKNKLATYSSNQIQIHFANQNQGFGHGHNFNARKSAEKFLLICNPDILVDQENLSNMLAYLEDNTGVLVAPKVLYTNGNVQYLFREKLDVFDYLLRFVPFQFVKRLFDKRLSKFECRGLDDRVQAVNFASGCFLFMRKSDFESINGFDERFFMYFEDNDFCQKYRQSGRKIMYLPGSHVIHFYAKEAHKSFKVFKIFISSMIKYFNKWGWKFF